MTLHESVKAALEVEPADPRDRAAADLALVYAAEIDAGGDLAKLGPALLATLEALQMSPRARALARTRGARGGATGKSQLDELRRRRDRKSGAADLDATAP